MKKADLLAEVLGNYQKFGWQLRSVLLRPDTRNEFLSGNSSLIGSCPVKDYEVDALWLSRPSHDKREAWELRLLSENQYALFETFEADETEAEREEVRLEMEARLREVVTKPKLQN